MTYQKLSIRPELFIGESLTSYLLRVAKAYKTSMKEVWKWYGDGNLWNFSKIDFYLSPTLNMDKIFAHMDKVAEQISSATFFALLESMHESNDQSKWGFLGVSLNSKHRRYCPKCIKELKSYNLIWQVQEIQICVKHQVYLQDSCLNCNHVIPYIHDLLSYGKCPNCSHSLSLKSRSCTIIEDIQFQESIYRQWLYMLNNPFIQSEYGNILNKGRYIATKLLFIAQNRETIMHRGRMNLTSDEISGLLSYIKDDEKLVKKYLVTLPRVLRIIRSRNIDIETLYELKVPKSYVRSIFDEGKEQELIGTCLAPWCPSFEQTRGLIALYYRSDTFRVQNEKYKLPHICMYCSLKYGLNQSGEWVESEGVIQTAYHGALPLLNAGVGVSKVAKKFNTDRFMVYRMIAYMIYHKLLNENAMEKFATIKIEKEPVKYFRLLSEIKGSKLVYARKNFGWNQVEYYFHYFHSSVQLFLHEAYLSENYVLSHEENEKKLKKEKKF
jgi:hypothetical protein